MNRRHRAQASERQSRYKQSASERHEEEQWASLSGPVTVRRIDKVGERVDSDTADSEAISEQQASQTSERREASE
jgi:hypothetical protein